MVKLITSGLVFRLKIPVAGGTSVICIGDVFTVDTMINICDHVVHRIRTAVTMSMNFIGGNACTFVSNGESGVFTVDSQEGCAATQCYCK